MPQIIAGRYGLSSKDFDPAMAKAVFDELQKDEPKRGFTVGINDDVSHTSLTVDPAVRHRAAGRRARAVLRPRRGRHRGRQQELRQDSRRGRSRHAQGYFVYDSKKSGSYTISHLRFGPKPIRAPYLLKSASFVGVHKFDFLFKQDVLARRGAAAPPC